MNDQQASMRTGYSPDEWAAGHLHVVMYGDLSMCGCGNPEDAYALVRDLLSLAPYFQGDNWQRANDLIGTPGAVHLILSALDKAGLMEHGMSTAGTWLTAKGQYALAAMRETDFDKVDEAGFPHYPNECTDACWTKGAA